MRYLTVFFMLLCICNISFADGVNVDVYPSVGGLKMGSVPLSSYMHYFGKTEVNDFRDEFLHYNVICYSSDDSSFSVYEWSNDDTVHEFVLQSKSQENKGFTCSVYANGEKKIHFDSGLRLGMERYEVLEILGKPAMEKFWGKNYKFDKGVDIFVFNKSNQNIGATDKPDDVYFDYTVAYDKNNKVNLISANSLYLN